MLKKQRLSSLSFFSILLLLLLGAACSDDATEGSAANNSTSDAIGDTSGSTNTGDTAEEDTTIDPNAEVACQTNNGFESLLPILNGGKTHPTGRGEQGFAYDPCNDRVILFGGNDFQPDQCADFGPKRFQGDTWIYSVEHENWARLEVGDAPASRGRHRMVLDSKRKKIILFGGRFRAESAGAMEDYDLFNDLWSFDLNSDTWEELTPTGDIPSPRANTGMIYDDVNDQVILFGGSTGPNGLNFVPQNDTYILDIATMVWTEVAKDGAPPARLFHSMVLDGTQNKAYIFSGGDERAFTGPFFYDLWALDLNTHVWEKVWEGNSIVKTGPTNRINGEMVEDRSRNRIVLFAGHEDSSIGNINDIWSFDLESLVWESLNPGDTGTAAGCSSFCSCSPDLVEVDPNSPERRQYHTFASLGDHDEILLYGGKGDCGYLDDTWGFSLLTDTWREIDPAGQGEACKRSGQEGCTDLCY